MAELSTPTGVTSRAWLLGAADRAVKSFAQTLLLLLGGGSTGLDLLHVGWQAALLTAAGAAVLSVLTSAASMPVGDAGSTSLLPGGR